MEGKILIKGILLNDSKKDILIENGKIARVADKVEVAQEEQCKVIDGTGKAAIPGFVNMHTHSPMTLMRGYNEDAKLMDWLHSIWAVEARLDKEQIYWATKLACVEMIKTGTTCFNDMYWMVNTSVGAVKEMGLRSAHTQMILDSKDPSKADNLKKQMITALEKSAEWGDMNRLTVGIHAPYSVSDAMIKWGCDFARDHGLKVHIHMSETEQENLDSVAQNGCSPFRHLERLGVLGPNMIAAHSLWLSDEDMDIMAANGVTPVHNINSNLKLASGYRFLYNELRDRGVSVCLGTDGCGSSNNLDMREAMKTAALLQKAWRSDPTAMPLNELMAMATVNGARALGFDAGVIEEGRAADVVIIDIDNYAFTPNLNFLSNLIFSANSSCVESVICNGRLVMEHREIACEHEILENVRRVYGRLYS